MHPGEGRVLLALGANVPGRHGPPAQGLSAALAALAEGGVRPLAVSGVWRCAPFGRGGQPAFLNMAIVAVTSLSPRRLAHLIRRIEDDAGRRRGPAWGPRALDIDILAHDRHLSRPVGMGGRADGRTAHRWQRRGLVLPHPGIAARAFVLLPLLEVAPEWRHPLSGATVRQLLHRLPPRRRAGCRRLAAPAGDPSSAPLATRAVR